VHNIVGIGSFETEDILAKVQHRNDEWKLLIHGIPIYATKIWRMNLVCIKGYDRAVQTPQYQQLE
jgi:hypothetical protein